MTVQTCSECPNFTPFTGADGSALGGCNVTAKVIYWGSLSPMGHLATTAQACTLDKETAVSPPPFFGFVPGNASVPTEPETREAVADCRGCKNYVKAVDIDFDSPGPVCSAKGCLITSVDTDREGCIWAELGIGDGQMLGKRTPYEEIVNATPVAMPVPKVARKPSKKRIDFEPSTYPTDRPVDAQHAGIIRAWRGVEVGEGDKRREEFIPIFEPEFFTETERFLIPATGDDEHPELYHDGSGIMEAFTVECFLNDEPLCLVGEPGTGKTEAGRWLAWQMQMPFHWLQITEETLPEEFLGRVAFGDGKTHFIRGRLPRALERPGLIMSDEFNTGQDSIRQTYRSINTRSATLFLEGEEDASKVRVTRDPWCFHLLSLNPVWDARNLGTREMADADVSRLSFMYVNEPNAEVISQIIVSTLEADGLTVSDDDLQNMLRVREDIKAMSSEGVIPFSWSIRQDVKVARKLHYYNATTAYRRALLDYCTPEAASAVDTVVRSHFGITG